MKNPYDIVKRRVFTEKAHMLSQLQNSESSRSLARCKKPKAVFIVEQHSNKLEIKKAVEMIYQDKGVKVVAVNTIVTSRKPRRVRGHQGLTASYKKAVVTFREGDVLDDVKSGS